MNIVLWDIIVQEARNGLLRCVQKVNHTANTPEYIVQQALTVFGELRNANIAPRENIASKPELRMNLGRVFYAPPENRAEKVLPTAVLRVQLAHTVVRELRNAKSVLRENIALTLKLRTKPRRV